MNVKKAVKLKDDETVLRVVRQTPLVFAPRMFLALLLISAPFFFMVPLFSFKQWGSVAFALLTVGGFFYSIRLFILWFWNAFVITNRRVVDIDQRGLFDRTVSEAPYDKIQDVSYRVKGFWGTLLNYGTIVVQTAGAITNLELDGVRDPKDVHHLITGASAAVHPAQSGEHTARVSALVEAAADLSDAEARAFLVSLQGAVKRDPSRDGEAPEKKGN